MERSDGNHGCEWAEEALDRYLDGELASVEFAELGRHWRQCPACDAERELAEHIQVALGALPTLRCPDHLSAGNMSLTRAPRRAQQALPWLAAGALAAACIAVLVAFQEPASELPSRVSAPPPVVSPDEDGQEIAEQARMILAFVAGVGRDATETVHRRAFAPAVHEISDSLDSVLGQVLPDTSNSNQ